MNVRWHDWPVAFKLTLAITGLMVLAVVAVTGLNNARARDAFQAELEAQADLLLDALATTSAASMHLLQLEILNEAAHQLGEIEAVVEASFYDVEGRVLSDSTGEIRVRVEADPFGARLVERQAPLFEWHEDRLEAGKGVVIGGQRLGAVSIALSTARIEERIAALRARGIAVAFVAFLVGAFLSLRISRSLTDPLRDLVTATERIAGGELGHRIAVRGSDELGVLAVAFNRMSERLRTTLDELRESEEQVAWRKRSEAEKQFLIDELETRNAEIERFTYAVSHDLKSPLTTILGFVGLLELDLERGDAKRQRMDMERIKHAVDQMAQLLDEVQEVVRVGRVSTSLEEVALGSLVEEALLRVDGQIRERGVRVLVAEDLPRREVDRPRLLEVFQNLIDNAIKFIGETDDPCVEIGQRLSEDETVFYVRDNGRGIDSTYLEKVFDLVERLDNSVPGTGIGLAMVKRIIEVHGGRIWVESKGSGFGSTFCFTLPEALPGDV